MYSLRRERDGAGDSGSQSLGVWLEGNEVKYSQDARPRVGIALQVGSLYARTYTEQDYWQTSLITEILKEEEDCIRFKTGNSIYEWRYFK